MATVASAHTHPGTVRDAVVGYADRLHRALPGGHRVTSPLGAWLVLALVAPAATGDTRTELERVLGLRADDAAAAAAHLLVGPHPAVAAAAAAWVRDVARTPALDRWLAALPTTVETGDVPPQDVADAWTRDHTLGLIEEFPLTLDASVLVVLCSALATKVSWDVPYDAGPAFGRWADVVTTTLTTAAGTDAILATPLGDVAVHTHTADGLAVTSVIAPAAAADVDVLDLAHRIVRDRQSFARRSLFDLPLGDHELWTVTERHGVAGRERYRAELPAWEARSDHALLADPGTGFGAGLRVLDALLGAPGPGEARQVALARYTREGFEAAAVSVMARAASAVMHREGPERAATLHFAHPYAVVATAALPRPRQERLRDDAVSSWNGLPVFAAWVENVVEA